jgi:uncharacterized membrane protein
MTDKNESVVNKEKIVQSNEELTITHFNAFFGPLPSPKTLEHYEKIQPGMCERIIRLTEKELETAQSLKINEQKSYWEDQKRRRYHTFIHSICIILLAGILAIVLKEPWIAAVISALSVGGAYLSKTKDRKMENNI